MSRRGGQDPPETASESGSGKADEPDQAQAGSHTRSDRDILTIPGQRAGTWWEDELRRLGDDILAEAVPERLRAICSEPGDATISPRERAVKDDVDGASDAPEDRR